MYRPPAERLTPHAAATPRVLALLVLGLLMLSMAVRTWRSWADPLVDFGREAYVPWQLMQGARLYVDVAYFNGPLSPYVNAAAMWAAGADLTTLFALNAAVFLAIIGLSFHLLRVISGVLTAFVGCATVVLLCGFSQYLSTGNYNYLAPYSHELTHGLLLSLAAISALLAFVQNRHGRFLLISGLCAGATLLTKPEVAAAVVPTCVVGVLLTLLERRVRRRRWFERFGLFAGGLTAPPVLALFALRLAGLGWGDAARGTAGAWRFVFDTRLHALPFYQSVAGTTNLAESLHALASSALLWLCAAAAGMAVGLPLRGMRRGRVIVGIACAVIVAVGAIGIARTTGTEAGLTRAFRAHGLLMLITLIVLAALAWHRGRPGLDRRLIGSIVLTLFALLLLAKIRFNVGVVHYGFALATPAVLVGSAVFVGWLPLWIDRRGGCGWVMRGVSIGTLAAVVWMYLIVSGKRAAEHNIELGTNLDAVFAADSNAGTIGVVLYLIESQVPSNATLAVIPEGALINLWTRRPSGLPFVSFMPPEAIMFGADRMAAALEKRPPDYVVINRSAGIAEYGYRSLADYLPGVAAVLEAKYEDVTPEPLRRSGFALLRRQNAPRL